MKAQLVSSIRSTFVDMFNQEPLMVFAPGRINLIGEHTDYNEGFVMPAAIDSGIILAISKSKTHHTKIFSNTFQELFEPDMKDLEPIKNPAWANYLQGIVKKLTVEGYRIPPFSCVFGGNILIGAGLSSSAALECAFAFALNELFDLNADKIDLIHIAQWAEHHYAGVKCGIMDQFTSFMGLKEHVLLLDCRTLEHQYFQIPVNDYRILICDTNVKHALMDSEFNKRRQECEHGVLILQKINPDITSLRDVTLEMIHQAKSDLTGKIRRRCIYVVEENIRVKEASEDLIHGDLVALGKKMYETHVGLSSLYEVSCEELDFLVDQTMKMDEVIGSRMMGGGFGGCTINIVHHHEIELLVNKLRAAYFKRFEREMNAFQVTPDEGVHILD